jgi:hypothetical protein
MLNGELCNVESTPYNVQEHTLELNTKIYVSKFGVNIGDSIPLQDAKNPRTLKLVNIYEYTLGNM